LLIVTDLSKLECDGACAVLRATSFGNSFADSVKDSSLRLTGRLTVGNGDDQEWLPHASTAESRDEHVIDDLLPEVGSHWSKTAEAVAVEKLLDLLLVLDTTGLL